MARSSMRRDGASMERDLSSMGRDLRDLRDLRDGPGRDGQRWPMSRESCKSLSGQESLLGGHHG